MVMKIQETEELFGWNIYYIILHWIFKIRKIKISI